jgi:SAM-dependent methyltransferase
LLTPQLRRADLVAPDQLEASLEILYRFILGRPTDDEGRQHYLAQLRKAQIGLREIAAGMAASDEFQNRVRHTVGSSAAGASGAISRQESIVDARELASAFSVEDLARTAEEYYCNTLEFRDRYLSKPFDHPHDVGDLLGSFGQLLAGLRLSQGMTVLDFGAGVCWTTRALAQLGCATIALDVSTTALDLGRELFRRLPPIGNQPAPRLLVFDGYHIDLPDESVDRIVCFDAFHHVPNPAHVMRELGRVLRPGGIAGFSEPGPHHSNAARSQYEMKNYIALENDIVMADVWRWAQAAGFAALDLSVFSTESHRVTLDEFDDIVSGARAPTTYVSKLRAFLGSHRTFFLTKAGGARNSRERDGLRGEIAINLERDAVRRDETIRGRATVQNVGSVVWLPGDAPLGGVNLGVHLRTRDGRPLSVDFARVRLDQGTTSPGDWRTVDFALAPPGQGEYVLEFDLVSEGVAWFEMNGSPTATVALTVH